MIVLAKIGLFNNNPLSLSLHLSFSLSLLAVSLDTSFSRLVLGADILETLGMISPKPKS